ncbi:MAG: Minf_1886 family protein [Tepidisphaeraceae bacterium]
MPPRYPVNAANSSKPILPTLREIAETTGDYPVEAFEFVQSGLAYAVTRVHGEKLPAGQTRHVSGQQLCDALREYALARWGLLARPVLRGWGITQTLDFGRIVFAMVKAGLLRTTEGDSLEDFRGVFDFASLDADYRIECRI